MAFQWLRLFVFFKEWRRNILVIDKVSRNLAYCVMNVKSNQIPPFFLRRLLYYSFFIFLFCICLYFIYFIFYMKIYIFILKEGFFFSFVFFSLFIYLFFLNEGFFAWTLEAMNEYRKATESHFTWPRRPLFPALGWFQEGKGEKVVCTDKRDVGIGPSQWER